MRIVALPYYSAVIQSFALATLAFYVNTRIKEVGWNTGAQIGIALALIAVIWHRYITHIHFVAWPPRWLDTVILICLGVIQYIVVFCVFQEPHKFAYAVSVTGLFGVFSYIHSYYSFNAHPIVLPAFEEHFGDRDIARIFYDALNRFHKFATLQLLGVFAFQFGTAKLIASDSYAVPMIRLPWFPELDPRVSILAMSTLLVCIVLFKFDIQWYLRKRDRTFDRILK